MQLGTAAGAWAGPEADSSWNRNPAGNERLAPNWLETRICDCENAPGHGVTVRTGAQLRAHRAGLPGSLEPRAKPPGTD